MSHTKKNIIFAVILISSLLSMSEAAVLPRTAKLVPPETIVLVDIDNFVQTKTQFEKTSFYKLYKDPAMSAFVESFKNKWQQNFKEKNADIFGTAFDPDLLPQGRAAFAVVTKNAEKSPIILISQWGDKIDQIKEKVDKAIKKETENGARKKTEQFQSVNITTLVKELPEQQVADYTNYNQADKNNPTMKTVQPEPVKTYHCFIDDCFLAATDIDILQFVIAHIKGAASTTLADDSDYDGAVRTIEPYKDITCYVNIKQLIKQAVTEDTTGNTQSLISNLGVDNVPAIAASIGFSRQQGSSCSGKMFVKINGPKKGICKMLEADNSIVKVPRFLSASTCSLALYNLNLKKAYDELYRLIYAFAPAQAAMMNMPIIPPTPNGQPGLQLKNGIIDHLGSQIVFAQCVKKPFAKDSQPTDSVVALEVSERENLEKSLSLLHNTWIAAANPDSKRELLGYTIYLVKMPNLPFFGTGAIPMQQAPPTGLKSKEPITLAFTVTDSHLILGTEPTVERAIRTLNADASAALGSKEWFRKAKAILPSAAGLVCIEDTSASTEPFWWMIKQDGKISSHSTGVPQQMLFPQKFKEMFDTSLLPEFDAVKKYFGTSVYYGKSRTDGFFFESRDIISAKP